MVTYHGLIESLIIAIVCIVRVYAHYSAMILQWCTDVQTAPAPVRVRMPARMDLSRLNSEDDCPRSRYTGLSPFERPAYPSRPHPPPVYVDCHLYLEIFSFLNIPIFQNL